MISRKTFAFNIFCSLNIFIPDYKMLIIIIIKIRYTCFDHRFTKSNCIQFYYIFIFYFR